MQPFVRFLLLVLAILSLNCGVTAATAPDERILGVGARTLKSEIPYSQDMTVTKAIIAAGGYSDFGKTSVFLVRCGEVTGVDMRAIFAGEQDKDVPLKPWDVIVIGAKLRATDFDTPRNK